MIEDFIQDAQRRMDKSVEAVRTEFNTVRTGRASAALLDRISVDYYGQATPLNQLAGINVPEPRLLVVTPYDKSQISVIEKAIMASDLGVTPSNDGNVIRLPFPALTEERRKEMVKVAHHRAEEGRVAVRNVRRHSKDELEKMQKEGKISEDDLKRAEKELQKETDAHVEEIDKLLASKEHELHEI